MVGDWHRSYIFASSCGFFTACFVLVPVLVFVLFYWWVKLGAAKVGSGGGKPVTRGRRNWKESKRQLEVKERLCIRSERDETSIESSTKEKCDVGGKTVGKMTYTTLSREE